MNADLIPSGSGVADVGCDHGYVSLYLAQNKGCRCIAMDVNEGPLAIARQNIEKYNCADRIECRLSDGLDQLRPDDKVNAVLIGGMGGMLICRILERAKERLKTIDTLVLQPQSDWELVRRSVETYGFILDEEACCEDAKKFYLVMRAVKVHTAKEPLREQRPYTEAQYRYGRILPMRRDRCYFDQLIKEKNVCEKVISQLRDKNTESADKRKNQLEHRVELLQEILSFYQE